MSQTTTDATGEYRAKVEIHDRDFQKFSIDHRIYYVPVDEVRHFQLVLPFHLFP
jgi:hypothetical protein